MRDSDIKWAVLGTNSIYPRKEEAESVEEAIKDRNRVILPKNVLKLDIAQTKRPLNWGRDTTELNVLISRKMDGFDNSSTSYKYADNVKLQENRVATIPLQFLEVEKKGAVYKGRTAAERPLEAQFRFRFGESVHSVDHIDSRTISSSRR